MGNNLGIQPLSSLVYAPRLHPGEEMSTGSHLLIAGDPHLLRLSSGVMACLCLGPCCFTSGPVCICEDCDCDCGTVSVSGESHSRPVVVPSTAARVCQDCGTEVFRNGTRGRWPSRCPDCKMKGT